MKLTIITYAALKEFFDREFELEVNSISSINDLKNELIEINPDSERLLNSCRFAVGEKFVNDNDEIYGNAFIHIIPPSSGG